MTYEDRWTQDDPIRICIAGISGKTKHDSAGTGGTAWCEHEYDSPMGNQGL